MCRRWRLDGQATGQQVTAAVSISRREGRVVRSGRMLRWSRGVWAPAVQAVSPPSAIICCAAEDTERGADLHCWVLVNEPAPTSGGSCEPLALAEFRCGAQRWWGGRLILNCARPHREAEMTRAYEIFTARTGID